MKQKSILLLASQSAARQQLLRDAAIPFRVVEQHADEKACDWTQPIRNVVSDIAAAKMEQVVMPQGKEGDVAFVLTADTLAQTSDGQVYGKPADKTEAREQLVAWRAGGTVATAFCLEKRVLQNGVWVALECVQQVRESSILFTVPDDVIEQYFIHVPQWQSIAGTLAVEGFGAQFVDSVHGSYTNIMGLPLADVRQALTALEF